MRTWELRGNGIETLALVERPTPQPGPGQVRVRIRATSLNYRDLMVASGTYARGAPPKRPLVPLSDGAGEVVAVGPGVSSVKPGDRVAGNFFQAWHAGPWKGDYAASALGGGIDGMLTEQVLLAEGGAVKLPEGWTFEEGATLPCAALTAWNSVVTHGGLRAGETLLVQGTGGVSVFALQIARALGAEVIATTSSAAKAERLKAMGADAVINYRERPDWEADVLALTGGRGVDLIVEVGGPSNLDRSMRAAALGGQVVYLGILGGLGARFDPEAMRGRSLILRTTNNGSRQAFEQMNAAIAAARLRPVIDRVFDFDDARAAYRHLEAQAHMGKVVIKTG